MCERACSFCDFNPTIIRSTRTLPFINKKTFLRQLKIAEGHHMSRHKFKELTTSQYYVRADVYYVEKLMQEAISEG